MGWRTRSLLCLVGGYLVGTMLGVVGGYKSGFERGHRAGIDATIAELERQAQSNANQ